MLEDERKVSEREGKICAALPPHWMGDHHRITGIVTHPPSSSKASVCLTSWHATSGE